MASNSSELFIITGLPGSGKTVLLSTLILFFGDRFWPRNREAQDFVTETERLKHQQWPAANNPLATPKAMEWDYSIKSKKYRLFVSDRAGEAWRAFVAENQDRPLRSTSQIVTKINNLREQLRPKQQEELEMLETQFQMAACVCIMIDLAEDINSEQNAEQKKIITAIMNYLEKIDHEKCPIALVVTKCKTYGSRTDWESRFNNRYSSFVQKKWKGGVKVIYTDAVADTITNDRCELIPAPNFTSYGLNELLDWIDSKIEVSRDNKLRLWIIVACICLVVGALLIYGVPPLWIIIAIIAGIVFYCKRKTK